MPELFTAFSTGSYCNNLKRFTERTANDIYGKYHYKLVAVGVVGGAYSARTVIY